MANLLATDGSDSTPIVKWNASGAAKDWRQRVDSNGYMNVAWSDGSWNTVFQFQLAQNVSKQNTLIEGTLKTEGDVTIDTTTPTLTLSPDTGSDGAITCNGTAVTIQDGGTDAFKFDGAGNSSEVALAVKAQLTIEMEDPSLKFDHTSGSDIHLTSDGSTLSLDAPFTLESTSGEDIKLSVASDTLTIAGTGASADLLKLSVLGGLSVPNGRKFVLAEAGFDDISFNPSAATLAVKIGTAAVLEVNTTEAVAKTRLKTTQGIASGIELEVGGNALTTTTQSILVWNSTVETQMNKVTLPANTLTAGKSVRVRAQGLVVGAQSTDTLRIRVRIGGYTFLDTGAVDVNTNNIWVMDGVVVCRVAGASGQIVTAGSRVVGAPAAAMGTESWAGRTLDTTVAVLVEITAEWSVASASDQARNDIFMVDVV